MQRASIALATAALACTGVLPQTITGTNAAATVNPTPTPSRGPRLGSRGYISGKLTAETATSLTVQGFGGTQTIAKASALKFFSASAGNLGAIKPGWNITIRTGSSSVLATSVTLVPAGNLFGLVQAFGGRGPRPSGTPRPGTTPQRRTFSRPVTGTVVALKGTALTIKATTGQIETGLVDAQTKVYVFSPVAGSTITVGSQVGVATASANGHLVAIALAKSSIPNAIVGLSTSL